MGNLLFARQSNLANAILQTLAYADVFDYPLTVAEIHRYLIGNQVQQGEIEQVIQATRSIRYAQGFYTLPRRENIIELRQQREANSRRFWPMAIEWGSVIGRLPFVRMVAVTGSLAMDNVEREADIDFLIVTEPGRLWLCRALVILAGRFAVRDGIRICPNYIVSLANLQFQDQSLYSAHELVQMVPIAGMDVYTRMRAENSWVERFLPNAQGAPVKQSQSSQLVAGSLGRPKFEAVLRSLPFTWIEHWEMKRKIHQLCLEQGDSPESEFSADICKGHAHLHRAKTNRALEIRLEQLEIESYP